MLKIGIIGYGERISYVANLIVRDKDVKIAAIADVDIEGAKKRAAENNFEGYEDVKYYEDAEEMLKNEKLDGVCIGTRCNLHTKMALLVAKYNIPMYLEKPVAVDEEELEALRGIPHMNDITVVSFPLRLSPMVKFAKQLVDSGKLGTLNQVQVYNNVPYGRIYYKWWYRDESITHGMFLQKATHDFDYINYILGDRKPVRICAMKTKTIFTGDEPAGMTCHECDKKDTCLESVYIIEKNNGNHPDFPYCCFAKDTGNEDSGSAIIEYDDGMNVTYVQNFAVRRGAEKRGARLIGFKATLEFDWLASTFKVYNHHEDIVETYDMNGGGSHGGGDEFLAENFVDIMKGKAKSVAPLSDGIKSVDMCLKAKKSSIEHVFMDL